MSARSTTAWIVVAGLSLLGSYTAVQAEVPSFVADAVQAAPGLEARSGKLYVSKFGTRFEFTEKDQQVVQIVIPAEGVLRLLFPKTRTYMEVKGAPSTVANGERPADPCRPSEQVDCHKEGEESIGDIAVERWTVKPKGKTETITIWWNRTRRMPLRQTFPDGSSMVAERLGAKQFEGRDVEQWKMAMKPASGEASSSYMLFAPDLGVPVMEQGATGLVKELHNIVLTAPDAALYEVPAGYQKVVPPAAAQPAR